jgi:hypothetical protein
MSFAAMLPRALIAWLSSDRSSWQREPAALVLTAAAGTGRGQLGVRQALLPGPRLPSPPDRIHSGAARGNGAEAMDRIFREDTTASGC